MKIKIRTDLLRKLANHVYNPRTKRNKRGLQYFRFDKLAMHSKCGTVGCALGELPYCFPKQWKTREKLLCPWRESDDINLIPILMTWPLASSVASAAAEFFGLSYTVSNSLFYSREQSHDGILSKDSSAEQVAAHIRKFCSKVEARRVSRKARND